MNVIPDLLLDTITEDDITLINFGLNGITNCCSDVTNASLIIENDGLESILSCLSNSSEECICNTLSVLVTLLDISFFLDPLISKKILTSFTNHHLDLIKQLITSNFKIIPNLATFCVELFEKLDCLIKEEAYQVE